MSEVVTAPLSLATDITVPSDFSLVGTVDDAVAFLTRAGSPIISLNDLLLFSYKILSNKNTIESFLNFTNKNPKIVVILTES